MNMTKEQKEVYTIIVKDNIWPIITFLIMIVINGYFWFTQMGSNNPEKFRFYFIIIFLYLIIHVYQSINQELKFYIIKEACDDIQKIENDLLEIEKANQNKIQ